MQSRTLKQGLASPVESHGIIHVGRLNAVGLIQITTQYMFSSVHLHRHLICCSFSPLSPKKLNVVNYEELETGSYLGTVLKLC